MKRKIIAVTGARSEYDILFPILSKLNQEADIELKLIVTGSHLSEHFGKTSLQIEEDNFQIADYIFNLIDTNEKIGRIMSLGNQITHLATSLYREKPDIVIVAGDREEAISVAMTCAYMNIVCAHLAGGDIAKDGNIDNSVRYATSKFAHIHFTILKEHGETLIKLGEDDWRIYQAGNPALDRIVNCEILEFSSIASLFNIDLNPKNYCLLIQHPMINTIANEKNNIITTLEAILDSGIKCLINSPNTDAGNFEIIKQIEYYVKSYPNQFAFFKNLDRKYYINLLRNASFLIGNSSSGLIEAPSLKLPAINIGLRQRGRTHTHNVLFVDNDKTQIMEAIHKVQSNEFLDGLNDISNPYGNGNSGSFIAGVLKTIEINDKLLYKNITY